MQRTLASRRPELLLLLFTVGYLVALTLQVRRGGQTVLGGTALALFGPVLTAYNSAARFSQEGFDAYLWQRDAALRAEALSRENLALRGELQRVQPLADENARLRRLLDVPPPPAVRLVGGRALMRYGEPFGRYLLVSCDPAAPVFPDTPVLDPDGVVGKVQASSGNFYRVLLVTDPSSAVGVMTARTGARGVAVGDGRAIEVSWVTNEADVRPGDRFVTSGEDGVFPPGISVGTAIAVSDGGDYLKRITLRPAAALDTLTWVVLAVKGRA